MANHRPEASPTCPICGSCNGWAIPHRSGAAVEALRAQIDERIDYKWTLCATCATAYPSHPPDRRVLEHIWSANRIIALNPAQADTIWQARLAMARIWAQRSFAIVQQLIGCRKGHFLDIACGLGETVALFEQQGWNAQGIDVDANTKPFHEQLKIRTIIGRIEDDTSDTKYDVIQIAHAIYFIQDPLTFLARVRERLRPGGFLLIVISDFLASTSDGMPSYAHTFLPCPLSMRWMLAKAGFAMDLERRWGGSIYFAARPGTTILAPLRANRVLLRYRTQTARYAMIGRPLVIARAAAKRALAYFPISGSR